MIYKSLNIMKIIIIIVLFNITFYIKNPLNLSEIILINQILNEEKIRIIFKCYYCTNFYICMHCIHEPSSIKCNS